MNADGSEDRYTAENVTSVFREPFYEEEITNGEVDPMEFDFNFGLASPLKDESTYNYDDPQLYQNVHVSGQSLQHHEQTQIHDSGGVSGGVPGVVPGAWSDVQWKMPGAFKGKSEDGIEDRMDDCINDGIDDGMEDCMELDPELDPSTHYNSNAYNRIQPEIAGYETRDVKVSNAFQFSITSPKCETSNGVFAAPSNAVDILSGQENSRKLDQDVACSYASESLSIEYGYNPAEADIFYNGQPEFLKNETDSLFYSATGVSPPGSDVALRDSFYNSQTTWNADSGRSLRWGSMDGKDSIGNRASISAALNDMSPLTTIASFTPSATSLHSTQHSYFSAQQFMRPSIDQPPSSLARGSMDFYSLRRPSLESINSAPSDPVRCQRSLASYFHFRDRERKSCMSPGPSPGSAGWSQPRHAIRSIFKTSNNDVPMDENGSPLVDFEHDPMSPIDQQFGDGVPDIDSSATKKSKRSKRKLFTRFKPTKGQGSSHIEVKLEPAQEGVRTDSLSDVDLKDELRYPDLKAPHSKGTSNSLNNTDSGGSSNGINLQEPDYASLFTGVGKRRNLVSIKSKKKHDPSVKTDSDVKSENENDKVQTTSFSSADNSTDCISAGSMPHSSHSYTSKDSISQEQTTSSGPSAFANASKRILGARLLKKKPVNKNESSSSDIVEVDLQELDLPENTEVFSTRSLLSKTRGRKEDKAADMVDKSKIYVCGYCDRRFKRQEHLKRHFRSLHTTQKPYDCPTCSKKFSRTDNLAQHLKIHKQEEEEAARQAGTSSES